MTAKGLENARVINVNEEQRDGHDDSRLTLWLSPSPPSGFSTLSRPLRIFSSFGNGGKKRGTGAPCTVGALGSGMFGGAEVNALMDCA